MHKASVGIWCYPPCFHSVHDCSNLPSQVVLRKKLARAFSQDFCPITALIETHCFWKECLDFGQSSQTLQRDDENWRGVYKTHPGILTPHLFTTRCILCCMYQQFTAHCILTKSELQCLTLHIHKFTRIDILLTP